MDEGDALPGRPEEGEGEGEDPQVVPHQDLWRALQSEREELKALRRKWGDGHWTVQGAQERVAAAEERWRLGKPATPLSRALQRAEQAVRRADERVDQTITKIKALDEDYNRMRDALEETLAEERTKARDLKLKLAEAQAAVGEEAARVRGGGGRGGGTACGAASEDKKVLASSVEAIQSRIAPQLAAVAEALEVGGGPEELRQQVHALMSNITEVHGKMQQRVETAGGDEGRVFDIADNVSELPELDDDDWRAHGYTWQDDGWHGGGRYDYDHGATNGYYDGYWGGQYGYHGQAAFGHHGYQRAWDASDQGGGVRRTKRRWPGGEDDQADMEVQSFDQMHSPSHLTAAGATKGPAADDGSGEQQERAAAATAAEAAATAEAATTLAKRVEAFRRTAESKGIDIADVDLDSNSITLEKLNEIAVSRFGQ